MTSLHHISFIVLSAQSDFGTQRPVIYPPTKWTPCVADRPGSSLLSSLPLGMYLLSPFLNFEMSKIKLATCFKEVQLQCLITSLY